MERFNITGLGNQNIKYGPTLETNKQS